MPVLSKIANKIFYLDIEDIRSADIDIKLKSISKDLNFNIISDYNNSECISTNYFQGYCMLWLPLLLEVEDIKIMFDFHHRKDWFNHLDLHELLIKKEITFLVSI